MKVGVYSLKESENQKTDFNRLECLIRQIKHKTEILVSCKLSNGHFPLPRYYCSNQE